MMGFVDTIRREIGTLEGIDISREQVIAVLRHGKKHVIELPCPEDFTQDTYRDLPMATYAEVDKYMAYARSFLAISSKGHREVASLTQTAVAEHMAFIDGKRLR